MNHATKEIAAVVIVIFWGISVWFAYMLGAWHQIREELFERRLSQLGEQSGCLLL